MGDDKRVLTIDLTMSHISVLTNFSDEPGLRHCDISDQSGEAFYHLVLNPAFGECYNKGELLTIDLDNTAGYASSFLDEAFGNLVYDFGLNEIKNKVKIISTQEPHWKEMIEGQSYIQWEDRRKKGLKPKVTKLHDPWYRLISGKLTKQQWEQPSA
jgi:hypothetical protein